MISVEVVMGSISANIVLMKAQPSSVHIIYMYMYMYVYYTRSFAAFLNHQPRKLTYIKYNTSAGLNDQQ